MKHRVLPALFLTLLTLLFSTKPSMGEETVSLSADSSDTALPDAPSATQGTTCTENNGTPCPHWVHKVIGQYPPLPESAVPQPQRDPSTVHFITYRAWNEPPLRTNKEVFRSKWYVGTHVGAAVAMVVACRNQNSGEHCGSQVPIQAGLFGMDYLQFRFIGGPNAIGAPIYSMIKYCRKSTH